MLGQTFSYIFKQQMEKLQDPDRFYYLGRLAGTNLTTQLETNSFSEMVTRNTGANNAPLNQFLMATRLFDMTNPTAAVPADGTPASTCSNGCVATNNVNGRLRWRFTQTPAPGPNAVPDDAIFVGRTGADYQIGGLGNDTLKGLAGNDYLDGNSANDTLFGGDGNDLFNDGFGNNLLAGANGDDVFLSSGGDTALGGFGADFFGGSTGPNVVEAGVGNDLVVGSITADGLTGNDHDLMVAQCGHQVVAPIGDRQSRGCGIHGCS